jgi:hypothetical protein
MNILHLITSINKGGAENHLTCLTRGQVIKKNKIFIIFLKGDSYWKKYYSKLIVFNNGTIHRYKTPILFFFIFEYFINIRKINLK